ncbi:MAG TPA: NAD(P)-binding domain-containing protein [Candidatus Limnocylindria bacterium]|nr:NAD(P)-binding domain-containing protein [Candidatus Limnocylindria bacterium]
MSKPALDKRAARDRPGVDVLGLLKRYATWLHTRWPAGVVEKLPEVREGGATPLPGVYISGDLTGIPLLKFSLDSGARAVRTIASDPRLRAQRSEDVLDLVIVGAGVSGMAAAMEARKHNLRFAILEATEPFSTLVNFPRAKPIYTYPNDMTPAGDLQVQADVKEALIEELRVQTTGAGIHPLAARAEKIERSGRGYAVRQDDGQVLAARCVLIAIGRSGSFRMLGVPGEQRDKVYNRLHDPTDFTARECLVVGGGDSALECAIALATSGALVTLSYRRAELARPKPENVAKLEMLIRDPSADVMIERPTSERVTTAAGRFVGSPHDPGRITLRLGTKVQEIGEQTVTLADAGGRAETIPNDVVFTMIGREPPLDFFRRSGLRIAGEMTPMRWTGLGLFLLFCAWLYDWKSGGRTNALWYRLQWFPTNVPELLARTGGGVAAAAADPGTLLGTLAISAAGPAFWYTLMYSLIVVGFGIQRMRRRRTPYVNAQTVTLMAVQVLPLFLIPEVVLPLLHHNGLLPVALADALFPVASYGHGREFWRAYGLILAWPLNVYNLFTQEPLGWWLTIAFVQTAVLIPLGIYFFGKGVYCGWICSCGALAETLGDTHRHKMPHGPGWNRFNLAGQAILAVAVILLIVRIVGWLLPQGNWVDVHFDPMLKERYKWTVDVFLAGVVGYGVYFWYSGRFWCRFLCPLAALMHVYARFSRFAIVPEKKKCISCNVCTTVCHQGIDVMNFANKGVPMQDPQCVRCSACVQSCPTGVLQFGQVRRDGSLIGVDSLIASPVRAREAG